MQILRYVDGQKYEPHTDAFHDQYNQRVDNGGQRIATVLMWVAHRG
jgi:prolyl 4-hydroxylase